MEERAKSILKVFKKFFYASACAVGYLLWPDRCKCCGEHLLDSERHLCQDCWDDMIKLTAGDYCPGCGLDISKYAVIDNSCPRCINQKLHFDGIARVGVYQESLRRVILKAKNSDCPELLKVMAPLASAAFQGRVFSQEVDFFIPVPIHWSRRFGRGFNQSAVLVKNLQLGVSANKWLVRTRRTDSQVGLSTRKRLSNVKNAFKVKNKADLNGRCVCLVDDIKTSGATLSECARTLKEAGASHVYALVLAVAGQDSN